MSTSPWIGVDLDGTLAVYDHWRGPGHIGEPIPLMVERVKQWLEAGWEVRIFTARITDDRERDVDLCKLAISDWCKKHIGYRLPITNVKDWGMVELYDDRAVQVVMNTGELIGMSTRELVPDP